MPNSNPEAVAIANSRIRPLCDRMATLYNELKSAQIEYTAENWSALFPADSEILVDGSAQDGRTPIINSDIRSFMLTDAVAYINAFEASSFATRNRVFKVAVNVQG